MSRLRVFLAFVLALLMASCSQPRDFTTPTLVPQFGTADDDVGIDVATVSMGRVYSLSQQTGPYQNGFYNKIFLSRQDASGKVIWTREVASAICAPDETAFGDDCETVRAVSLVADSLSNISALTASVYSAVYDCCDTELFNVNYAIRKYDALGQYISSLHFEDDLNPSRRQDPVAFTTDGSNFYVVRKSYTNTSDYYDDGVYLNIVTKYSASGTRLWQRLSKVGVLKDITVASSGNVYVVGTKGLARYTNSGNLTWTKPGNFEQVMISGSNLFTRYRKEIRKWDGNGKQLWRKVQGGLNTLVLQDMDGDGNGNVYLSGKYQVSGPNWNAMVRKLNPSGSSLWTKTYGTPAYDDAKGIATLNGSEIYTTGLTRGDLAHTNKGGEDGYLRKLNLSGNPLWTR